MKNIFALPVGRSQSPRPNFKAFTSAICSFAILIMPFAQMAAATRVRSELRYQSSKVKDVGSTNRAAKNSETGNVLAPAVQSGSPSISATLTDNRPSPDPAVANPGDTINYTAIISNTGTADATGVQFNLDVDANTTVVTGSVKMSPLAFADSYNGVLNTQLIVAAGQGVLVNDVGLPAPTAVPISGGSTTQGGTVTLDSDGGFTYMPPADFAGGSDTFTYTATNAQPPTDTAIVTITIPCQTITVTNPANNSATYNVPFSEQFSQTGGLNGGSFSTVSALPSGLSLDSNTGFLSGTPTQTGTFNIIVSFSDGNGCGGSGPTYQLNVAQADQTITFTSTPPANATVGGSTYEVTATATSGLPVTFAIDASAASVCSISGSTVSFTAAGNCFINADQAGDGNYNAAPQVQQSFPVGQADQTITFTSTPPTNATVGGPTYEVTATATSGLPVTFAIDASAASVCSISGSTVSFIGGGTCVINADQAGDSNYNPAPQAQQSFAVDTADQTISFTSTAPPDATVGGSTYEVTATATSGLTVTFAIDASASTVCSISGSTVSFIAAGTCVINADQAGDGNYNAAPQVQQSFAVTGTPPEALTDPPGQSQAQHGNADSRNRPNFLSLSQNEKELVRSEGSGLQKLNHARGLKRSTRNSKSLILTPAAGCTTTSTHVCVDVGTLPLGKSVTITFSVTVNTPYGGGSSVSTQGTVSGSNFSNVVTNDPDTGAANDATVTPICGANLVVTNTNNSGNGSLRQTILNLCPGGTITFDPALTSGGPATITLTSAELVIDKNLTINGPTNNGLTISGNSARRIFNVNAGVNLSISNLTIANGLASQGGGILNDGTLTINDSTISNNKTADGAGGSGASNGGNGGDGAGIYNTGTGTLKLFNSTISGNQTGNGGAATGTGTGGNGGNGAGIYNQGSVTSVNVTISKNTGGSNGLGVNTNNSANGNPGTGSGLFTTVSTVILRNTIVAPNDSNQSRYVLIDLPLGGTTTTIVNSSSEDDVNGTVDSSSAFNLIGVDGGLSGIGNGTNGNKIGTNDTPLSPKLDPLADNGGPTFTHLPQSGSPVLDAGDNALAKDQNNIALANDQRGSGFTRIINGTVEIGAVETAAAPPSAGADLTVIKSADQDQVVPDRDITYTIIVSNSGSDAATTVSLSDPLPQVTTSADVDPFTPTFAQMTFVSLNAPGWTCTTPSVGSGGTVSCSRASLAGSSTSTLTLVAHVPSNAVPNTDFPFISNVATVSDTNDTNTENDSGSTSTLLIACVSNPVVTTNADTGLGSLRRAIADACVGSTITFDMTPGHVVSPITLISGELAINKNLTILGPGANLLTVSGNNASRVFNIQSGTVAISNLTIANGKATSGNNGGGVLNSGTLTLTSSIVNGNNAAPLVGSGGGLYNSGTLTLNGSTVTNNTAPLGGGGVYGGGTLTLINSTISGNNGAAGNGGGIFNGGATLTVINSTVSGNTNNVTTGGSGGGIYNSGGPVVLTNSTISGNSAASSGGGIFSVSGTVTLTNMTVTNNRSDSDNSGGEQGGGIFRGSGTVTLKNTIVAGNFRGTGSTADDISGTVDAASSFNLIGTGGSGGLTNTSGNQVGVANFLLGVLANNGGATQTHLLLPGSPAINAGSNALLPADAFDLDGDSDSVETLPVDQRGTGFARVVNTTVDIGAVEVNYSITATAGTPQSATVNTAFATALKVNVTESGIAQSGLSVTFTAPGSGASGTFPGPSATAVVVTNSSGDATAPTFTANASGGTYDVVASIATGLPTGTFVLTNIKLNQTITFAAPTDKTFGDPDFTVTATATSGLVVSFAASGNCTVTGTGTGTVHITGAGSCTITASQAGDPTYSAAPEVPRTFNIAKAATTTAVTSSVNPSSVGQSVTFTATVTSPAGTATGTVQFKDGGTNLGPAQTLNGSGVATFSTTALVTGIHTITAEYSGDANFLTSTGTLSGGQIVGAALMFSATTYNTTENSRAVTITVQRTGDSSLAVTVDYATPDDSSATPTILPCSTAGFVSPRCDFTTASGTLRFASGENSKTFEVLISQDNYVEGNESFSLTLSNPTNGGVLGTPSTATVDIADDVTEPAGNPIDDSTNFVRQHYHDFLNREPLPGDAAGLNFWVNQIEGCGSDQACRDLKRINVSGAFFLSVEFQKTGYYVYRTYKTAFGDINPPTVPVPVRYLEFMTDTQEVGRGVVVGQGAWQAQIDANKQAYALAFVSRSAFLARYPAPTSATAFVDTLNGNAGNVLTPGERTVLISQLSSSPADPALRADVLIKIAENGLLKQNEFNRAFVMMQYFGYLRRNPDAAPESGLNFAGFNFWLNKLNSFNGDFIQAEMVRAFITSAEYRQRFGP